MAPAARCWWRTTAITPAAGQPDQADDAYIATLEIRKGKIGEQDPVTVSEHAWRTGGAASGGGSTMFLPINSQVTVDDLLHGIIIQSGNDAKAWPNVAR